MARRIRIFGKKRGEHWSGSSKAGALWITFFSGTMLVVGGVWVAFVTATVLLPDWHVNNEFRETVCTVIDKRLAEETPEDGPPVFRPEVQIEYTVAGRKFVTTTYDAQGEYMLDEAEAEKLLERFRVGEECACFYDPAQPRVAVLVRGVDWWNWLLLLIPISCVLVFGSQFAYSLFQLSTSAERRAALTRRVERFDPFETPETRSDFPFVPNLGDVTNSPGTTLRYRLPARTVPIGRLLTFVMALAVWGVFAGWFFWNQSSGGDTLWFSIAGGLACLVLAGALVLLGYREFLVTFGIAPTCVEISDLPLLPGAEYSLRVLQPGRLALARFEVILACDERAVFLQGTDTRTEETRIHESQLALKKKITAVRGEPFVIDVPVKVPATAMHSFKAPHNEVQWKLIVTGRTARRLHFERIFPLIVYPAAPKEIEK